MKIPQIILLLIALLMAGQTGQAQNKPEVVVTAGHVASIGAVAFHPGGKFIATGSHDQSIKLWDKTLRQEFRTLYGHKAHLVKLAFSPQGKYLASMDVNRQLIIWAHPSGKKISEIITQNQEFAFSPTGNEIFFSAPATLAKTENDCTVLWDIAQKSITKTYNLGTSSYLAAHPNQQQMIRLNGKNLEAFGIDDQEKPVSLLSLSATRGSGVSFGVGHTHRLMIAGNILLVNRGNLTVIDLNTRKIIATIAADADPFINAALVPNGKQVVAVTSQAKIKVFDAKTGKLQKTMVTNSPLTPEKMKTGNYKTSWHLFQVAISPDSRLAAISTYFMEGKSSTLLPHQYNGITFWTLKDLKNVGSLDGTQKKIVQLGVTANEELMVSSTEGVAGLKIWNMKEASLEKQIATEGALAISRDGNTIAFREWERTGKRRFKIQLKAGKLPQMKFKNIAPLPVGNAFPLAVNNDGTRLAIGLTTALNGGRARFFLILWDLTTNKLLKKIKITDRDFHYQQKTMFSSDSRYLMNHTGGVINTWNLQTGKKIQSIPLSLQGNLLDVVPGNAAHLIYSQWQPKKRATITEVNYITGKVINKVAMYDALEPAFAEIVLSARFSPNGKYLVTGTGTTGAGLRQHARYDVQLWDWANKAKLCTFAGHTNNVGQVWYGKGGRKVYSAAADGIIKVWNIQKCTLAASFIGMNTSDYLILTPDNYYKSSKGNIFGVGFRYQGRLRTYGQFDVRFHRPDLVLKSLEGSKMKQKMYFLAWKKRLKRLGFSQEMLTGEPNLPQLEISNKSALPIHTRQATLKFEVKALAGKSPLRQVNLSVNEVPVYGSKGYEVRAGLLGEFRKTFSVKLNRGKNRVKVWALNQQGIKSVSESFEVDYEPTTLTKPNLYVLAVGVSQYADSSRNLKYAAKDARDLAAMFRQVKGFNQIRIRTVVNKEATIENIQKMAAMFKQTNPDDYVVIHLSCHGLLDDNLDYYLATTNVNFAQPADKGLPYEVLEKMLDKIPARNRLITIDACHSGEVDKNEMELTTASKKSNVKITFRSGSKTLKAKAGLYNSFDYMKALFSDVSNSSGATIISAASGMEYALESKEWNNGVFTYALLEGIKSGKADINQDGQLQVSELKTYISQKVYMLTEGRQMPTTRKVNQSNDFVLIRK